MYSSLPAKIFYCNHLNSLSSLSHAHTYTHTNLFIVITKITFVPSENPSKIDLQTTSLTLRAYKTYKENTLANTIIMYDCTAMHVLSRVCI